jgi:hypothetical protein
MSQALTKIKDFFLEHETKIVLFIGFCLVSAISYEFGVLQGQKWQQKPLVIEKPIDIPTQPKDSSAVNSEGQAAPQSSSQAAIASKNTAIPDAIKKEGCSYVGSKNSNKFYLPTCSYAKRIKPENVVCFKSAQDAIGQGRTESKCN